MSPGEYRLLETFVYSPGLYVDIGCWMGFSTKVMAEALIEKKLKGQVLAIDPLDIEGAGKWGKDVLEAGLSSTLPILEANLEEWGVLDRVVIFPSRSQEVEIETQAEMVVIDGSHRFEDVKQDFLDWYPRVREGGYLAFHDYGKIPGPTKVVDQFVREKCQQVAHLGWLIIFRK